MSRGIQFPESRLAHSLLDGLVGIEIGGSAHNAFGLNTKNVDQTAEMTHYKHTEVELCGRYLPVDIVAEGDNLPLEDQSVDFVISSHVIEHFSDPIKALKEWYRVVRNDGYIFIICPHKDKNDFDKNRERTKLSDVIEWHEKHNCPTPHGAHCVAWIVDDLLELVNYLGWKLVASQEVDDKVGNGFTVVIRVKHDKTL